MTKNTLRKALAAASFMIVAAGSQVAAAAATETLVHSFDGTDGAVPDAGVIQGSDGNFYGTTSDSNTLTTSGHVYKLTPGGTITALHVFDGVSGTLAGLAPKTALVQGSDGAFYGTASSAAGGSGTVFKVTADGTFTNLYTFTTSDSDGAMPLSALVQGVDGNFYGTTFAGGTNVLTGFGTVFKITPSGTLTTIYAFNGVSASQPSGDIVFGADGALYGTTQAGGTTGFGTVYKLALDGTLTVLHSFNSGDGSQPVGGLVLGSDGNFYGTTSLGGSSAEGTIFKIASDGRFTSLHSLSGIEGSVPNGTLVEGTDGNFYGFTTQTIFQITPSGSFTKLLDLSTPATTGASPFGDLILATDGALYGTASAGGASNNGVVFKVALSTTTTATPTFSPAGGTYSASQSATISDATTGATIYYTIDGSTPTIASTKYVGPITVSKTETVKAIAASSGNQNSAVATAVYTITPPAGTTATPTFIPAGGSYNASQSVTISDATTGATIYYAIGGSTPTASSTQYTGPITVSKTETVKSIAVSSGNQNSAVATAAYTIAQSGGGGGGGSGSSGGGGGSSSAGGSSGGGGASSPVMLLMLAMGFLVRRRWISTPFRP